jgi:hypothetical protein
MDVPEPARGPAWSLHRVVTGTLLLGLLAAALLAVGVAEPAAAGAPSRREQVRFMWAMAGQESGWDYYARNASSGAFGKYQIMPFNWPAWAAEYLGDGRADQTPWNQERVAFGKIHDLYRWLGSWKRVAYWWLTGSSEANEKRWSAYARGYVQNIMRLRLRAPKDAAAMPARTSSRPERGDWRRSAMSQRLRMEPGGRTWRRGGSIRDGQVLRVHRVEQSSHGNRWIEVVTRDGRLGWLPQLRTLPGERPSQARFWRDIREHGGSGGSSDRRPVRPRPR